MDQLQLGLRRRGPRWTRPVVDPDDRNSTARATGQTRGAREPRQAIAAADRDLGPDPLRYLGDLLRRRDTIENAREWPLDTTALSRIAIYFIIPPIAWVGAAFVEQLVTQWFASSS